MRASNIQQYINDKQYHNNVKDGINMNERAFISYIKFLIKEYGAHIGSSTFISLDDIPHDKQVELLKKYYFFEGYLQAYQEVFSHPLLILEALKEDKPELEHWLLQYVDEVEEEFRSNFIADHDLVVIHAEDNGESRLVRR